MLLRFGLGAAQHVKCVLYDLLHFRIGQPRVALDQRPGAAVTGPAVDQLLHDGVDTPGDHDFYRFVPYKQRCRPLSTTSNGVPLALYAGTDCRACPRIATDRHKDRCGTMPRWRDFYDEPPLLALAAGLRGRGRHLRRRRAGGMPEAARQRLCRRLRQQVFAHGDAGWRGVASCCNPDRPSADPAGRAVAAIPCADRGIAYARARTAGGDAGSGVRTRPLPNSFSARGSAPSRWRPWVCYSASGAGALR